MTNTEKRSREVADLVKEHAQLVGVWNEAGEKALIAACDGIQQRAAEERVKPLLPLLECNAVEVRPCRLCRMRIALVKTPAGALMPVCLTTGLPHHANCPNVDQFRKKGA